MEWEGREESTFQEGFRTGDVNRARLLFELTYNEL
jgi:hypothetical protein